MISRVKRLRTLAGDRRGAAIVEAAFIAPMLIMILMVFFDFLYNFEAASKLEGTIQQAARMATIGDKTESQVDDFIRNQLTQFNSGATITINKSNYYQFSNVSKSEKLVTDSAPLGVWNTGDCYEDLNNNGKWDTVAGRSGLGGSDDILFYRVQMSYPRVVPLYGFLGWSNTQTLSANTIMRNQPYAVQAIPIQKCTST
jgi:Flp pilus assembly protein TadG